MKSVFIYCSSEFYYKILNRTRSVLSYQVELGHVDKKQQKVLNWGMVVGLIGFGARFGWP